VPFEKQVSFHRPQASQNDLKRIRLIATENLKTRNQNLLPRQEYIYLKKYVAEQSNALTGKIGGIPTLLAQCNLHAEHLEDENEYFVYRLLP
jgi:hypothetical protein